MDEKDLIVIADDLSFNRDMLRLIVEENYKDSYEIVEAANGQEAIDVCLHNLDRIVVMFLDIDMPIINGFEVVERLKKEQLLDEIPVIMVTSMDDETIERAVYDAGVADYILKPITRHAVECRLKNIIKIYTSRKEMQELLEKNKRELQTSYDNTAQTLSQLMNTRYPGILNHQNRMQRLVELLADTMSSLYPESGLAPQDTFLIKSAALTYDIGKITIPDAILLKPGKLSADELELMRTYVDKGASLIDGFFKFKNSKQFMVTIDVARYHHERYDGNGYPNKLSREEIPLAAQIVGLADAYDALASKRVYKEAYPLSKCAQMISDGECGMFSPRLLKVFNTVRPQIEKIYS